MIGIVIRWMSDGADDVAYALRGMRRRPGFAAAVVLTLALGIAASTSVFSVVSAVLLKPLPYPDADRLVLFAHAWRGRTLVNVSLPRIAAWRAHTDAVEEVAIYRLGGSMDFSSARPGGTGSGDDSTQVIAGHATSGFFRLLGAAVLHGRVFTADEDRPHGPRVAVLSHGFWRRRFGAAPDIVGRTISLEGLSHLVVGVLSPTFDARSADPSAQPVPDLWVPLQPDLNSQSDANNLLVAARLKPGVSLGAAQAQAKAGTEAFRKEWPANMPANLSLTVIPLADAVVEDTRPSLLLLAAAVAFVLLVGTGLLMRSFVDMRRVSPGFETARMLSMTTLVTAPRYAATSTTTRMMDDATRTVGAVPGVEAAGATLTGLPLEGEKSAFRIGLAAKPEQNLMARPPTSRSRSCRTTRCRS